MASFSEHDHDRLDWKLFQWGAIALYFRDEFFLEDADWLSQHAYVIHKIDCANSETFQQQMSAALNWNQLFGYEYWNGNLDALNDGFRHLEIPAEGGLAFCFKQFNLINRENPQWAQGILDVIEWQSHDYMLLGRRLLCLVQSNNPRIAFDCVGARDVQWNPREWFYGKSPCQLIPVLHSRHGNDCSSHHDDAPPLHLPVHAGGRAGRQPAAGF